MASDRRRDPRLDAALDATVEVGGREWHGRTVDLSPSGVKVTSSAPALTLSPGTSVHVRFALPDGGPSLSVPASVIRTDTESVALAFVNLGDPQVQRLKALVDSLMLQEWQALLTQFGSTQGSSAGLSNPRAGSPNQPGPLCEIPEPTLSVQKGVPVHRDSALRAESTREGERGKPEEPSVTLSNAGADQATLQQLLAQAGLDGLRLPDNGVLCQQWRNFLNGLGAEQRPPAKPKSRDRGSR